MSRFARLAIVIVATFKTHNLMKARNERMRYNKEIVFYANILDRLPSFCCFVNFRSVPELSQAKRIGKSVKHYGVLLPSRLDAI